MKKAVKWIIRRMETNNVKRLYIGITLATNDVGKSKVADKSKPKNKAGPKWKGGKATIIHL